MENKSFAEESLNTSKHGDGAVTAIPSLKIKSSFSLKSFRNVTKSTNSLVKRFSFRTKRAHSLAGHKTTEATKTDIYQANDAFTLNQTRPKEQISNSSSSYSNFSSTNSFQQNLPPSYSQVVTQIKSNPNEINNDPTTSKN